MYVTQKKKRYPLRNVTKMWRRIISSPYLTQTQVQVLGKFRLGTTLKTAHSSLLALALGPYSEEGLFIMSVCSVWQTNTCSLEQLHVPARIHEDFIASEIPIHIFANDSGPKDCWVNLEHDLPPFIMLSVWGSGRLGHFGNTGTLSVATWWASLSTWASVPWPSVRGRHFLSQEAE